MRPIESTTLADIPPLLQLQAVTKQFPGVLALDAVSFDVWAGEVHAVCGENGAGKSTLMKLISGQYQADSGYILYEGTHGDLPILWRRKWLA